MLAKFSATVVYGWTGLGVVGYLWDNTALPWYKIVALGITWPMVFGQVVIKAALTFLLIK